MASRHSYLLTVLLPGAGHIHEHQYRIGWPIALLWTACWHVILLGVWVIPRFFADWMVPAALVMAGGLWIGALISLTQVRTAPASPPAPTAPVPTAPDDSAAARNDR